MREIIMSIFLVLIIVNIILGLVNWLRLPGEIINYLDKKTKVMNKEVELIEEQLKQLRK